MTRSPSRATVEQIDTRHPIEVVSVKLAGDKPRRDFENGDVAFIPVTRFNLRMQVKKDGWSAHLEGRHLFESPAYDAFWQNRIEMFERICVPSVLNLTPRPHAWFIAIGETRPRYVRELLERLEVHPWIRPYYPAKGYPDADTPLPVLLAEHARTLGKQFVCTTRFDSDDSLHQQFYRALDDAISQMRALGMGDETRCLNLLHGLVESSGELSIYLRRSNMFESIFAPVESPEGPYGGPHDSVRQRMPLVEIITNLPMWMYHRHGDSLDTPGVIVRDRVRLPAVDENVALFGLTMETMAAEPPEANPAPGSANAPEQLANDASGLAGSLQETLDLQEQRELAALATDRSEQTTAVVMVTIAPGTGSIDSGSERMHERAAGLVGQGFSPYVVTAPESPDERESARAIAYERDGVTYRALGNHEPNQNGKDAFRRGLTKELAALVAEVRPCLLATDGSYFAKRVTADVARAFSLPVEF